jgi:hypothetical protein
MTVAGRERDRRQHREQDHQRVHHRVREQLEEARARVRRDDVRSDFGQSPRGLFFGETARRRLQALVDPLGRERRDLDHDRRHVRHRLLASDRREEVLRKDGGVDPGHADAPESRSSRAPLRTISSLGDGRASEVLVGHVASGVRSLGASEFDLVEGIVTRGGGDPWK